jgi:hypothetical protein
MPIDPNIPLQSGRDIPQFGPDIKQLITMAALGQRMQMQNQEQQGVNLLGQLYKDPNNLDSSTGDLKPEAINQVMQVAPRVGLGYKQDLVKNKEIRARQGALQSSAFEGFQKEYKGVLSTATQVRDEALNKGYSPETALQQGQKSYTDGLNNLKNNGGYAGFVNRAPPNFDPVMARGALLTLEQSEKLKLEKEAATRANVKEARESRTTPKPIEVTSPDGKKTVGTGVYNRDNRGWETPEGQKIEGNVREVSTSSSAPDEQAQRVTAQSIANYQQAPLTGYALRSPGAQQIMAMVSELNPDYQATRYPEVAKAMRDFGTGTQGNTTRSLNVAVDHLDSLRELVEALHNNENSRTINRIANFVKTEFGLSSAPTTFDAARTVVGAEVAKAIIGGASALGDREEARAAIDKSATPQQLMDVIGEDKRLMAGQLGGLEKQYQDATGFGPGHTFDFRKKLSPKTVAELESAHTPRGDKKSDSAPSAVVLPSKSPDGIFAPRTPEEVDALLKAHPDAAWRRPGDPPDKVRIGRDGLAK